MATEGLIGAVDSARRSKQHVAKSKYLMKSLPEQKRIFTKGVGDTSSKKKLKDSIPAVRGSRTVTDQNHRGKSTVLEKYGDDLTELVRRGKLDPVIGRDEEIQHCIKILCRMTKNNPIIIGEHGVGKTAIVEGLAQRIVQGHVPKPLLNRKLVSLDIVSLLAGVTFHGDFEERLQAVLKEVTASNGKIILFIDDICPVVDEGIAMDAGNLLFKSMLVRGQLCCIRATTLSEYKKYFEKDPALERRFQQVHCAQPSVEDTISILRALRERYELHHGVKISDNALVSAAVLSDRYITERFLPDKAIDLVDEAASNLKMEIISKSTELDEIDRAVLKLEMETLSLKTDTYKASEERLSKIEADFKLLRQKQKNFQKRCEKEKALVTEIRSSHEEIDKSNFKMEAVECDCGLNRAAEARMNLDNFWKFGKPFLREEVTDDDISEIISKRIGIPLLNLLQSEMEKPITLEEVLHERVAGQDIAIKSVGDAIRRSRAGLSDPNRHILTFLFMDPIGVDKTALSKALAGYLFNTENALIRIDMSEYMEKHTVSRLVGAPPGYVGYEEGGQLTEFVRRRPYSVVLFDKIEKAHHDVFNILLQVLNDGMITDSLGRQISFTNCVIIMTSNIGAKFFLETLRNTQDAKDVVYERMKRQVIELARQTFRPEFMNAIDEYIVFQPLELNEIKCFADIQLKRLKEEGHVSEKDLLFRKEAFDALYEWCSRNYDDLT
ncbi:chaperone protein ClpB4, mitochondrial-like [Tasmannia lanceolata]|uniref:chaperone protein ClpB4, mitochondrial-like n=1 Tax=Tasmannia lanceolata TaxID=3420 RepID=UPI0040647CB2